MKRLTWTAVAGLVLMVASQACSTRRAADDDDDGGSGGSTSGSTGAFTTGSSSTVDDDGSESVSTSSGPSSSSGAPTCVTCGQAVFEAVEGELCPGSQALIEDLAACVCGDACVEACYYTCYLEGEDGDCLGCADALCFDQVQACLNDTGI